MAFLKKHKKLLFLLLAGAALVGGLFLLFGKKQPSKKGIALEFSKSNDPELAQVGKLALKPKLKKDSFDLINQAFAAKKIDINKYILLKTLALFAPDYLPDDFKSDAPYKGEHSFLIELNYYFKDLNKKTQNLLKPFTLLPDNKDSYFNPKNKTKREQILKNISNNL